MNERIQAVDMWTVLCRLTIVSKTGIGSSTEGLNLRISRPQLAASLCFASVPHVTSTFRGS
jgi:hypothetical protein